MAGAGPNPVTMADVARQAGVSTATVSRTLSGIRAVDPDLQSRVLTAADVLGYRVNLVGRTLRQGRSSTVGLIVPDFENPFFSSLAQHLTKAFAAPGIDLLVFSADSSLERELRGVHSFVGRQVDALVVIPVHEVESAASISLAASSVATIQLDRQVPGTEAHSVGVSNRHGMRLVHEHVSSAVDLARQPGAFVGAMPTSSSAHERLDGFRKWFGDDEPILLGSFDATWGQEAATRLIADGWTSGTLVTAADVIATGLMSRLQAAGFRVPGDFRVIGFDGIGMVRLASPTLTTVRQPVEAMTQAIRELVESGGRAANGEPVSKRIKPELVLGASSPAATV